jgi:hypothetical protein
VSPTQLLNYHIPVEESLAYMYRMVTTDLVIFYPLILRVVVLVELEKELMEVVQSRFIRFGLLLEILRVYPFIKVMLNHI